MKISLDYSTGNYSLVGESEDRPATRLEVLRIADLGHFAAVPPKISLSPIGTVKARALPQIRTTVSVRR